MPSKFADYIELTKPRINVMVLVTTAMGYLLGGMGKAPFGGLCLVLSGTALTCGGAAVLNNYLERESDALMKRTAKRPIPAGRISPGEALGFGLALVLVGTAELACFVNILSAFLALLSAFLYTLVYTPLKKVTWLNTFIGAFPGAMPPLGGWAAATGTLELGAWALFLILFIWQHPHFFAIAWMYRDDYRSGGLKMLPTIEEGGVRTFRQMLIYSILLVPASALPFFLGMSGKVYLLGSFAVSLLMLAASAAVWSDRSTKGARRVLQASIIYLPVLLVLIAADFRLYLP